MSHDKLRTEGDALRASIASLESLLADRGRVMGVVKAEALEFAEAFGVDRRSRILVRE